MFRSSSRLLGRTSPVRLSLAAVAALMLSTTALPAAAGDARREASVPAADPTQVHHRRVTVDGIELFYREAGPRNGPVILLLHGFPTSSQMYRNLIPRLADRYRVIAPDYPGFGQSAMPPVDGFEYTFDRLARLTDAFVQQLGLKKYALYVMDYGAPVGFRLATAHPERVTALLVQNGNAYDEGIGAFWDPIKAYWQNNTPEVREQLAKSVLTLDATRWQYTHGVPDVSLISPDAYTLDFAYLQRPGNKDIQLALIYDYRTNLPLYDDWQRYFRKHQPPTLVVWGKNDEIFLAAGAEPYRRDNPKAEVHLLDTGHFALETHAGRIAALIRNFLARH